MSSDEPRPKLRETSFQSLSGELSKLEERSEIVVGVAEEMRVPMRLVPVTKAVRVYTRLSPVE